MSETIYDRHGAEWWAGRQPFLRLLARLVPARLRHFDRVTGGWAGRRVLDLGCGGGFMAEALARRGARVIGLDPALPAVAAGQVHRRAAGLEVAYLVGRGEALPLAAAALDAVVCVDVLEHVDDLPRLLSEVARVLRPGGLLLFDTVHDGWLARLVLITLAERLLGLLPRGTHDPARFLAPARLARLLEERGLAPGPVLGLGPVGLDRRLSLRFGRLPTARVLYMGHAVRRAA